ATSSALFVVCKLPCVKSCRTAPTWAPKPICTVLPDFAVPGVLNDWPRMSVNEISDVLYPTVFRFARLLPMTLSPWLLVERPERPVEKVVRPMLLLYSLEWIYR